MLKLLAFMLGSILGSFISCLAIRQARGESIIWPNSHCDSCQKKLKPYEMLPVFSYIFLKGRCRTCGKKIGLDVFISELFMGLSGLFLFLAFGPTINYIFYLAMASLLLKISLTDYYTYRIYDTDLLIFFIFCLIALFYRSVSREIDPLLLVIQILLVILSKVQEKKNKIIVAEGDLLLFAGLFSFLNIKEAIFLLALSSWIALIPALYLKNKGKNYIFMAPFISLAFILILIFKNIG